MADNSDNILKQLQQYGILPPADAFDKAWQCIADEKEREGLKTFSQLQDHTLPAPELNFNLLIDKNTKKKNALPGRFTIPLPLMRAAAVLLVVAAATVLYLTVFNKKGNTQNSYAGAGVQKNGSVERAVNEQSVKTNDTAIKSTTTVTETKNIVSKTTSKNLANKKNFATKTNKGSKVSFGDGNTAIVYDNDVLFTLVNYKGAANSWGPLFTDAVADKTITLNKYSYLNLSDKMVAMLQDVYLTKKNGKPTGKAKRVKRKCEKWRKKDEKNFDRDMQKNPVDIIDLSDFIL